MLLADGTTPLLRVLCTVTISSWTVASSVRRVLYGTYGTGVGFACDQKFNLISLISFMCNSPLIFLADLQQYEFVVYIY